MPDLESLFFPDVKFDLDVVNQVVAEHIFRLNLKEVGEAFLQESNTTMSEQEKSQFEELNQIINNQGIDLDEALSWAKLHEKTLKSFNSDLIFKLHKMKYLELFAKAVKMW